jgi:predicted Rossmann fold nucleotide-binding protein DprA/Smf involved in DNA uptake
MLMVEKKGLPNRTVGCYNTVTMGKPINVSSSTFPALARFGSAIPPVFEVLGELDLLLKAPTPLVALLCANRCPADLQSVAQAYAQRLRVQGMTTIGGFFTSVETEMLEILLRGTQPLIRVELRNLANAQIPNEFKRPLEKGRLLLISPYPERRRLDRDHVEERNRIVAALAERIVIIHAEMGGKLERLCAEAIGWGSAVYTPECSANLHLIRLGAQKLGNIY